MRRIDVIDDGSATSGVDLVAVPIREEEGPESPAGRRVEEWTRGGFSRARKREAFRGEAGETGFFAGDGERPDVLVVGLGAEAAAQEELRRAAGVAIREARSRRARSVAFLVPGPPGDGSGRDGDGAASLWQAAAEGVGLGDWEYAELRGPEARKKRPAPPERVRLSPREEGRDVRSAERDAARAGRILAEAQNAARALVAQPGNLVTPRHLASHAERLGEERGLRVEAWGREKLSEEGFGALLAVARGSIEEPRFLILEHEGGGGAPVVFVGKGVTFDAGGISLKPAKGMEAMKYDMAGAAAVLGILQAAADLDLERRVVGLVPATENLPSGSALKPADVIRGVAGTSIEVVNTDAEGRLILSDALAWARRLDPEATVDLATLTGGCVVALGHHAAGLMTPEDDLADALAEAGDRTGERVWRLPLWKEYRKQLDSEIADIKNAGGREASPITAGRFLQEFVGDMAWAHLDIAGTAWADEARGWQPEGATGVGVRLLVDWLRSRA